MIRLTLRQFRTSALIAFGLLALVAVVLAITHPGVVQTYAATIRPCRRTLCPPPANLLAQYQVLRPLSVLVTLLPALIGIFWGAPLVARELETGTYRMVLTQSVGRVHWFAVKLGIVGLVSIALAGLFSWAVTWWMSPFDHLSQSNSFALIGQRDIVPIGYAAFAFVLGVTAGMLIRKTLPAMAVTLGTYAAVRLAVVYWLRPNFVAPAKISVSLLRSSSFGFGPGPWGATLIASGTSHVNNAWEYGSRIVNTANQPISAHRLATLTQKVCPGIFTHSGFMLTCMKRLSATLHLAVTYQPPNRLWTFEIYETGMFLFLALVLAGFCLVWVRARGI